MADACIDGSAGLSIPRSVHLSSNSCFLMNFSVLCGASSGGKGKKSVFFLHDYSHFVRTYFSVFIGDPVEHAPILLASATEELHTFPDQHPLRVETRAGIVRFCVTCDHMHSFGPFLVGKRCMCAAVGCNTFLAADAALYAFHAREVSAQRV